MTYEEYLDKEINRLRGKVKKMQNVIKKMEKLKKQMKCYDSTDASKASSWGLTPYVCDLEEGD